MNIVNYFKSSIFRKLIGAFAIIAAALVIFLVLINVIFIGISQQYDSVIRNYTNLSNFFTSISDANNSIKNYVIYNSDQNLNNYYTELSSASEYLNEIKSNINSLYVFGKMIDLQRMIETYQEGVQKTLEYNSAGDKASAYISVTENDNTIGLITARTKDYYSYLTSMTEQNYNELIKTQQKVIYFNIVLIVAAAGISAMIILYILKNIKEPVNKLYVNAKEIAEGNFSVQPVSVKSTDEISVLAEAFNNMVESINFYIEREKEKAELEKKLIIEENKNLQTKILLRQTKLQALESKINPHFLFNTLNMIAQTAYIENSKETREMIEVTSDLLRFYLDKAGENVSLKEELENVANYIYIQQKRFGNRVKFDIEIDYSITNIQVPAMIIQPLIENSLIHGLSDCTNNGMITVKIQDLNRHIQVQVVDNGKGMEVTDIRELKKLARKSTKKSIGIDNIIDRLELLYGKKAVFSIDSEPGTGATITLKLPKEMEKTDV